MLGEIEKRTAFRRSGSSKVSPGFSYMSIYLEIYFLEGHGRGVPISTNSSPNPQFKPHPLHQGRH